MAEHMMNEVYDAGYYGRSGCEHKEYFTAENLYKAYKKTVRPSAWKGSAIQFKMSFLPRLHKILEQIENRTYTFSPSTMFTLSERGKVRLVRGECVEDRIVGHVLCDEILNPIITKHLIYDNGACIKDKGIDFARRRLVVHMSRYYRAHGNKGYVLLVDFSKYYDNIRHGTLMDIVAKYIDDEVALWLIDGLIKTSRIDTSALSQEEHDAMENGVFNSSKFFKERHPQLGKRYLSKHLFMGSQFSQIAGVLYPGSIDSRIKTVEGEKFYGRYMDDIYVISESKEHLRYVLSIIEEEASKLGITLNNRKTRISPIDKDFTFLQIKYRLTETGKVVRTAKKDRIAREQRRLKKVARKVPRDDFIKAFNSWYGSSKKMISGASRKHMLELYNELLESIPVERARDTQSLWRYLTP